MRETLYQLGLTLALPLAVGAVWIARAERAEPAARERATPYRVELPALPLPVREQLRPPGLATAAPVARSTPDDRAPRRRRPPLPEAPQLAPAPIDLAWAVPSKRDPIAAASPDAAHGALSPLPQASRNPLRTAPLVALAAPSLSSRRGTAPAATVAPTTASEPAAATRAEKPVVGTAALDADAMDRKQVRLTAMRAALSRDWESSRRWGAEPAQPAKNIAKLSGGTRGPVRIDPSPSQKIANADGYAPLVPSGPIADRAWDFSLWSGKQEPSILTVEAPLPAFETAQATPAIDLEPELSAPAPSFAWSKLRPGLLVLIPEPGTAILLGASLAALGALRRRRRRA